jgi:hypothetical protein
MSDSSHKVSRPSTLLLALGVVALLVGVLTGLFMSFVGSPH